MLLRLDCSFLKVTIDVAKDAIVFSAEGEMGTGSVKLKQNPSVDKVNIFLV